MVSTAYQRSLLLAFLETFQWPKHGEELEYHEKPHPSKCSDHKPSPMPTRRSNIGHIGKWVHSLLSQHNYHTKLILGFSKPLTWMVRMVDLNQLLVVCMLLLEFSLNILSKRKRYNLKWLFSTLCNIHLTKWIIFLTIQQHECVTTSPTLQAVTEYTHYCYIKMWTLGVTKGTANVVRSLILWTATDPFQISATSKTDLLAYVWTGLSWKYNSQSRKYT